MLRMAAKMVSVDASSAAQPSVDAVSPLASSTGIAATRLSHASDTVHSGTRSFTFVYLPWRVACSRHTSAARGWCWSVRGDRIRWGAERGGDRMERDTESRRPRVGRWLLAGLATVMLSAVLL